MTRNFVIIVVARLVKLRRKKLPPYKGEKKIEINLSGVQQIFSGEINACTILVCVIALFLFFGIFSHG